MPVEMTRKMIETMLGALAVSASVVSTRYQENAELASVMPPCKLDNDMDDRIEALKLQKLGLAVVTDSADPDRETYPWKFRLTPAGFAWITAFMAGRFFKNGARGESNDPWGDFFFATAERLIGA